MKAKFDVFCVNIIETQTITLDPVFNETKVIYVKGDLI